MARKNGKRNKTLVIIIILVLALAAVGVLYMQRGGRRAEEDYKVVEVTRQDMQTTVRGSGVVEALEKTDIYAPSNIVIEEVYLENGDEIKTGDAIAKIDKDAYLDAEKMLTDSIDNVNASINSMFSSKGEKRIYSPVNGTVKEITIAEDEYVEAVLNRDGYLMLISADNNMRLELSVEDVSPYTAGDMLYVQIGDENIEAVITDIDALESTLKVIFEDDEYTAGQQVDVFDANDNKIGTAEMKINVPVYIEGEGGTVSYIYVKVNDEISTGTRLIRVRDNEAGKMLMDLTEQKEDLENQLADLRDGLKDIGLGSDYIIYATSDGIMDSLVLNPYMMVAEGMKMFTIQSTHPLMMYVPIDELDIAKVEVGQVVELKFEALPDEKYIGEIVKINTLGQSINGVTNYIIKVTIQETGDILIGMSGNAKIMTDEKKDVLTVPVEAVQLIDDEYYVIMGEDANIKTVADRKIVTGLNDGAYIEVIEGLTDGDTVAVPREKGIEAMIGPGR